MERLIEFFAWLVEITIISLHLIKYTNGSRLSPLPKLQFDFTLIEEKMVGGKELMNTISFLESVE